MSKKIPDCEPILFGDSESPGRSRNNVFSPEFILKLKISESAGRNNHHYSSDKLRVDKIAGLDIRLNQDVNKILDVVISSANNSKFTLFEWLGTIALWSR